MVKDLTTGKPAKVLFFFALPMILGNVFQQLYNIVDSMVVGNFVGEGALAAVGISFPITFLCVAIATGSSLGCSVIISQLFGAGQYKEMKTAVFTALISILSIGVLVTGVGLLSTNGILALLNTPDGVFADAATYLNIYFGGAVFLFLYNTLTAVFNSLGDSRTPLYFLILSSLLNIVLDLVFVINFNMGVAGVAWATLIAQGLSAILSFSTLLFRLRSLPSEGQAPLFNIQVLQKMAKVALPSTLQQSIVSIGMLFVQALVNSYGQSVVAGYTAATKIDSIAMMPMINMSNAMSSFTAQNMGAGKPERVKEGYRASLLIVTVICVLVTSVLFLFGAQFVGGFVDAEVSRNAIDTGVEYLRVVSIFYVVMGVMFTTNGLLRGAGDMFGFTTTTLLNFTLRVVFAYVLTGWLFQKSVWWSIPLGWTTGAVSALIHYKRGKWRTIRLVSAEEQKREALD